MQYYDLKIVLMPVSSDIKYEESFEKISKLIFFTMEKDEELKMFHKENKYKNYVFSSFYPIEKDGIYKVGRIYTFDIRCIDIKFAMKIKNYISQGNYDFKVIMTNIATYNYKPFNIMTSLTPVIITADTGYNKGHDLDFVKDRIIANAEKKYKQIYNEEIHCKFIDSIECKTNKAIKIKYKGKYLLGYKYEIKVKKDEISQKLAYILMATGIGEKNSSLGGGYAMLK